MKFARKTAALILAAIMALSLFGCSSGGSESSSGQSGSSDSAVDLEVWYAISGNSGETFVSMAEEFDNSNDNISLELSYSGNSSDTATKVSAALLSGDAPDVALMYAGPLYTGGRDDFTMQELIKDEDFNADDIYSGMWDYCSYMDKGICAVPFGISTQIMYYNKDLVEAAGIDMTNPPETWDEFLEVAETCMEYGKANVSDDTIGFDTTDSAWLFKSMLKQNGCDIIETSDGTITADFADDAAVEVADYWKSLVDAGVMPAGEHSNAENKFLAGTCAFIAASSNRISRWEGATTFEIGAIEMPSFGEKSLALGGNVLVILTDDETKVNAAWEFIKAMTTTENNIKFSLATGYLPIRKSAVESSEAQQAITENEMYGIAFKQLDYAWSYYHFEQMGTMDSLMRSSLDQIEKGVGGTTQEVLESAVSDLQREIDEA
ncbi:MAG: ABC transporter substrate-binding protein [Oscillospiraceae bacterium]|jgi:sn-glycerol 3-phosphate transport system substrate-binding protein